MRPYQNSSYEVLLRAIGLVIPTSDQSPDLSTPEARAFHAMSELWQRLIIERRSLHRLPKRRRLDIVGDDLGAISDARKYPHIAPRDPAMLVEQIEAIWRKIERDPNAGRRRVQQAVANLACFKYDRDPAEAFRMAWQLVQNRIKERPPE